MAKYYYQVLVKVSETVYSKNLVHAAKEADVVRHYMAIGANLVSVNDAYDMDINSAIQRGMPVIEIEPEPEKHIHISYGNSKIGKIPNFNLTPGTSCSRRACETCHVGRMADGSPCNACYACKAYKQYPAVRKAWDENTDIVLYDQEVFEREMDDFLTKYENSAAGAKADYRFRIHSAGDFITQEYMLSWGRLIAKHPRVKFLAFTKQYEKLTSSHFSTLTNLSCMVSGGFGLDEFIPENLRKEYHIATIINHLPEPARAPFLKTATVCPGSCVNCAACWNANKLDTNIGFIEH